MNKYYYDLHIHSCLSPCADNDMTPNNIAGMAVLAGLNIIALTDHNTTDNCPAFFEAAKANGLIPIAGMELTTAEDIHAVCLFEELEAAMEFNSTVRAHRIMLPNRTDIFGDQLKMNAQDEVIGTEDCLLSNATDISIEEAPAFVEKHNGICYPAHIDREANGIIATLGIFPDTENFKVAELHNGDKLDELIARFPIIAKKKTVISSDAHFLWDIRDKSAYFEIDDEPYSGAKVRHELFKILKGVL